MTLPISLIIKKCIVGTLPLGLAGSGTNKFSALTLENLKGKFELLKFPQLF